MAKQEKNAKAPEAENVMVVNIKYSPTLTLQRKQIDIPQPDKLPEVLELTIPAKIYELRHNKDYFDAVETFVYNLISSMYGRIVTYCQIYFP